MTDTTSGTPSKPAGELTNVVVLAVVALTIVMVAAVVVLEAIGRPVTNLLVIVTAILGTVIPQMLNSRKIEKNSVRLADVHTKVNGRLDGVLADREALEDQLRAQGLIPVTRAGVKRLTTETDEMAAVQGHDAGQPTAGQHRRDP